MEWLYTGHVVTLEDIESLCPILIRLYVLGDFLCDDRFSNAVMDALILESQSWYPWLEFSAADVDFAWEKTIPGSRLRKVLVELIIRYMSRDVHSPFFDGMGTWCQEVTARVFARMAESKQIVVEMLARERNSDRLNQVLQFTVENPNDSKNRCADYHKHDEGYPRCS